MEWKPIETAPKDDVMGANPVILVCDAGVHPEDFAFEVTTAFWSDGGPVDFPEPGWYDWHSPEGDDGVWQIIRPTHWMPLPPPPTAWCGTPIDQLSPEEKAEFDSWRKTRTV